MSWEGSDKSKLFIIMKDRNRYSKTIYILHGIGFTLIQFSKHLNQRRVADSLFRDREPRMMGEPDPVGKAPP